MKILALTFVAVTWRGSGDVGHITIDATVLQSTTVKASAHDGVLTVNWNGEDRLAFYSEDTMAITLTEDGGTSLGGRLVWAGKPQTLAAR